MDTVPDDTEDAAVPEDQEEDEAEFCASCTSVDIKIALTFALPSLHEKARYPPQDLTYVKRAALRCKFCRLKLHALRLDSAPSEDGEHYVVESRYQTASGVMQAYRTADLEWRWTNKYPNNHKRFKMQFYLWPKQRGFYYTDDSHWRGIPHTTSRYPTLMRMRV
ncbi:hypothetical protein K491DRAFT_713289 [Lophiostoma macrostomum CBS 122681]|uniref:Uncharacterized protein n=1 Tax=Lophiostoma macrostomum CBS 122681 TaxID=1314788 RepID=A0A6A6TIP2_9PLEO|nr:hypothetical protein K491DRAFT_713289 [Lophiostoma macrostomum CBS 122681]